MSFLAMCALPPSWPPLQPSSRCACVPTSPAFMALHFLAREDNHRHYLCNHSHDMLCVAAVGSMLQLMASASNSTICMLLLLVSASVADKCFNLACRERRDNMRLWSSTAQHPPHTLPSTRRSFRQALCSSKSFRQALCSSKFNCKLVELPTVAHAAAPCTAAMHGCGSRRAACVSHGVKYPAESAWQAIPAFSQCGRCLPSNMKDSKYTIAGSLTC